MVEMVRTSGSLSVVEIHNTSNKSSYFVTSFGTLFLGQYQAIRAHQISPKVFPG